MKRLAPIACFAALVLAGCADRAPSAVDQARIERLMASIDELQQVDGPVAAAGKIEEKIAKADRVSGTLARVQADKLDPNMVVALVAR